MLLLRSYSDTGWKCLGQGHAQAPDLQFDLWRLGLIQSYLVSERGVTRICSPSSGDDMDADAFSWGMRGTENSVQRYLWSDVLDKRE